MTNDTPSKEVTKTSATANGPAGVHRHGKHRRHGYRGYPNRPELGGRIHHGTGFAGVGTTGSMESGTSVFTEKTTECVEEQCEDPAPGRGPRDA